MKMQMLKVGEPDKEGQREYLFSVMVNREPTMYQVRARHEADAQQRLRNYVDADTAALQELGGAAGAGTVLLLVGAAGAAMWAVRNYIMAKRAPAAAPSGQKKRPVVLNGAEVERNADNGEADGSARSFATASAAPTDAFGRSSSERLAAAERSAGVRPLIRPIIYNGMKGSMAGAKDADPAKSIRIVVFSDTAPEPFLTLVRPASFDSATGTMRDAIVVMSFPASAVETRTQDAVEVFIGGKPPREVDVHEETAEAALASIRKLLGGYI